MPSTINGTTLSALEFRDSLHLRYARTPPNLPTHCDGCCSKFSVSHALQCKKGGLVTIRHDEIKDELIDIASRAFTPSAVRDEPVINPCRATDNSTTADVEATNRNRGDVLIRGLWERGTDCIIDVRVTDTNAKSVIRRNPEDVLEAQEREKMKKHLKACQDQRRHFTPFVVSCTGRIGKQAKALIRNLAGRLSDKPDKSYSTTCGFLNARALPLSVLLISAFEVLAFQQAE